MAYFSYFPKTYYSFYNDVKPTTFTIVTSTYTTITLPNTLSSQNNAYKNAYISIVSTGETRKITSYDGDTRTATVDLKFSDIEGQPPEGDARIEFLKNEAEDGSNFSLVTNIFTRTKFIKEVLSNALLYYKYEIKEGETPEIVAYNFYGDPQKHWIVLYANSILDPHYEWVLHSQQFENYIIAKYGSLEDAKTELHHYELKIEEYNSVDGRINERVYTITDKDYNFATKTTTTRTLPTVNSAPIKTSYSYSLSDGSTLTGTETYTAVSNYDYEFYENEKRRVINVLNPDYASTVENELKELLS